MKSISLADIDTFEPNRVSIVQLAERTGTPLTKSGNLYVGLCPFHPDRDTPSLRVYPNNNSWCCFGSGCGNKVGKHNGGGPIDWIKQKYRLDYRGAYQWLKQNFNNLAPAEIKEQRPIEQKPIVPTMIAYWHSLLDLVSRRTYFNERGFTDDFIDQEMFGWDGERYVIPVWEGQPGRSDCLGVRRRRADGDGVKYKGLKNHNAPTVWGRWHCRGRSLILAFAGEFDAARAVQDGLSAFSVVNGVNVLNRFPKGWPALWFPDACFCLVCFDKKEEIEGAYLAEAWSKNKGLLAGRVFHWPPEFEGKDYCDYRDTGYSAEDFMSLVTKQL